MFSSYVVCACHDLRIGSVSRAILPTSDRCVQNLFTIELITIRYRYGLGIAVICTPSAHHVQKALRGRSTRDLTSATNLVSNGELLSLRHINETEKLTFKSITGNRTTSGGH